jgi:cytoskeletal protein RodZ
MTPHAERLVRMEVEVSELKKAFEEHKAETKEELSEVNRKLDDLLTLRNKGAGIFWLVSGLFGAGLIGAFWQFVAWMRS